MAPPQKKSQTLIKVGFTLVCLIPLAWLAWRLINGDLGASPAERINHKTGLYGLRLVTVNLIWGALIALAWVPKPLKRYGYLRRHLGVTSFVYIALHLTFYFVKEGELGVAATQLFTKTYLILGLASYLILLVLTVTSADWAVRKLRARWKTLHRLVYPALVLAVLHFAFIEKKDWTEAWPYLGPLAALYVIRFAKYARGLRPRRAT